MKTPIDAAALKQHMTYNWWKYVLLIVLSALLVNLYYSATGYQSPENKRVEMMVAGIGDDEKLTAWMKSVGEEHLPEMEVMRAQLLVTDSAYGPMQLVTYIAAGQGDIFLLPRDEFVSNVSQGAWVALENDAELMAIFDEAGLSLQSGWRRNPETGENHLYGIPMTRLPGLQKYCYVENGYLSVLISNQNDENVMKFLRILCKEMIQAPEPAP